MPSWTLAASGLSQLRAAAKKSPEIVEAWLQKAVVASVFEVQKRSVRGPVPYQTGRLSKSIGQPPGGLQISRLQAKITTDVEYAIFVHEGTRFIKPNRFMPRLLNLAKDDITRHFKDAVEGALAEISA